jgi:hypothetical protein
VIRVLVAVLAFYAVCALAQLQAIDHPTTALLLGLALLFGIGPLRAIRWMLGLAMLMFRLGV